LISFNLRRLLNRDNLFVLVITAIIIVLILMPTGFEERFPQGAERVRGLVLEVDNSGVQQFGIVKSGAQGLRVKILDGPFEGRRLTPPIHYWVRWSWINSSRLATSLW